MLYCHTIKANERPIINHTLTTTFIYKTEPSNIKMEIPAYVTVMVIISDSHVTLSHAPASNVTYL